MVLKYLPVIKLAITLMFICNPVSTHAAGRVWLPARGQ